PEPKYDPVARRIAAIAAGAVDVHQASALEALPGRLVYEEPAMRPLDPTAATLVVRAQMGVGKTQALRAYLDAHFPAGGGAPPVVVIVTFRQTFSRSLQQGAFRDFALYK